MIVTDQLKILDNKIRANRAQYDLVRKNAEISALSSSEIEKYEYITGKDLEIKPSVVDKAKLEYSPLGRVFNEGLDKSDRKEGVLKRLKNIEEKTNIGDNINNEVIKYSDSIVTKSDFGNFIKDLTPKEK